MTNDYFKDILTRYFLPMFPGAYFEGDKTVGKRRTTVCHVLGRTGLKVSPSITANYFYIIRRSQPFTNEERDIAVNFVKEFEQLPKFWKKLYREDLVNIYISRVVARSLCPEKFSVVSRIFSLYSSWAQQTYEGTRISSSIGIDIDTEKKSTIKLPNDLSCEDYIKVITNGYDTLLSINKNREIIEYIPLSTSVAFDDTYAPYRYIPIAQWSQNNKIGITLTRNGEILVFKNKVLKFAKRRGTWRYFSHHSVIKQIANKQTRSWDFKLRKTVYLTALDVSFSRTGGCIGIIRKGKMKEISKAIDDKDFLSNNSTDKHKLFNQVLENSGFLFENVNRKIRQELVAIDGATVLDNVGKMLAIGAILKLQEGSTGGGRLAAAKNLAQYGAGIKISNDGKMEIFVDNDEEPLVKLG